MGCTDTIERPELSPKHTLLSDTESEFLCKPLKTSSLIFSGYNIVTDIFYFLVTGCAISYRRFFVDKFSDNIGLLGSRGVFLFVGMGG